jgi:hypothetical protein
MRGRAMRLLVLVALAALLGLGAAWLRLRTLVDINDIAVGPWRSSSLIGSPQASPYLRAVIAVNAILALNRSEAMYFTATEDGEGRPLDGACRYRVEGHDVDARWWSLTAYGADRFLIPNPGHRYSVTRNTVARDAAGGWSAQIGGEPQVGDWIATAPGRFLLTLRAYNPQPALAAHPETANLPKIVREICS